jgi:hypothetical protein
MIVTLELPAELEAYLAAQARARNISIDELLKELLASLAGSLLPPRKRSIEEIDKWERDLDEWLDTVPEVPTLSDEAISREGIYTREDAW